MHVEGRAGEHHPNTVDGISVAILDLLLLLLARNSDKVSQLSSELIKNIPQNFAWPLFVQQQLQGNQAAAQFRSFIVEAIAPRSADPVPSGVYSMRFVGGRDEAVNYNGSVGVAFRMRRLGR